MLHISHTDVRTDSRILKELAAHHETGKFHVYAIGVSASDENPPAKVHPDIGIESLKLVSNKTKWNPRALRHFLTLLELIFKATRRAIKCSPDVIHCHDTLVLPIGYIVKLFTGAKLVYDAHELESDKNGQTALLSKATLLIERCCWRSVDLLVSVSPSILTWYDETLGKKKNVLVLNSPVFDGNDLETPIDASRSKYFHERFDIPDDSLVFIYLGILSKGRGIELILEAFSSSEINSHVVFMGFGDLSESIRKKAEQHANVHLHPPVTHDMVVQLTKSADVGLCLIEKVSLSDYYCLPNKLFEYAFSGIPVLASNFPDLKNYVDSYKLGFCSDIDSASMSRSIRQIERNPPDRITADLTELSWQYQAERLVAGYDNAFE
ncbi:MAG: glycosyltransferase [Colwellia sp.]|nr:glycosyltransferase [Colwellia sp.]